MGRQRAPPPPSSPLPDPDPPLWITTENSPPPNLLQFDLQTHKEATEANLEVLRESVEFVKNQQVQFRNELLDEFRQLQLGSKSIEGQPSNLVHFSSSSASKPLSQHVLPITSTPYGTHPNPNVPLPNVPSTGLGVSNGLPVPLIPSTVTFSNSIPIPFTSFYGDLSGLRPISDSIPFNYVPFTDSPNPANSRYHIPSQPYKPSFNQSEHLYATRPTVYSQFPPSPFTSPYVGPSHYHNLDPSNYHLPDHFFGFPSPSMDPNLPTMKQMRLDFPTFGGGDPVEWLNKAEQYFILYQIPDCKKVSIASMHLIDEAANIWHLFQDEYPGSWAGFSELFMKEFGGNTKIDYQAALAKMYQHGSVTEYKTQFNKLSRRAFGFSREVLLACFVSGLKEEIRFEVRAHKPATLLQAYELARIYEEKLMEYNTINREQPPIASSSVNFSTRVGYSNTTNSTSSSLPSHSTSRHGSVSFQDGSSNRKQLSQAEYEDRSVRT